jgi:cysteine desulfurase
MSVYLDYAATSPLRDEVLSVFTDHLKVIGNPSSVHSSGQAVRRSLEDAREVIAAAVGAHRSEIIFTSGGTESNNLAIKGLYWQRQKDSQGRNIVISAGTEHHAVIDPIEWLVKHEGAEAKWLEVSHDGEINLSVLEEFVRLNHERISLISLMWANNEIGVINDIAAIAEIAARYQIPLHSDAVAAFGHTQVNFAQSGLATMSISAHKVGGPVGIGALVVARAAKLEAIAHGGGQERGIRSGTLNAAGAQAFALAAKLAAEELDSELTRIASLRDDLISRVLEIDPTAKLTGATLPRLANNAHFVFRGCSGDSLLFLLDQAGVCVSVGSACQAGINSASHVLLAMGRDEIDAWGCLRMTLGHESTQADVDAFIAALPAAIAGARKAGLAN